MRRNLGDSYSHNVEEAFRSDTCGIAFHDLLQDLLKDAKSPADSPLHQSAPAVSCNDNPAAVHQARSNFVPSKGILKGCVTPTEPWYDPGARGTTGMRQKLVQSLLRHGRTTELLPSAQSLSRYVCAFLDGFNKRYPLFHMQTMPLAELPADLAFAMLAVGADSCLETKAGIYLLESAVAVSSTRLSHRQVDSHAAFTTHEDSAAKTPGSSGENAWLDESSHVLCLMLLLTVFGLENRRPPAMQVMWSVQGVFAHELRQSIMSLPDDQKDDVSDQPTSWPEWARRETRRRVKHAAFCVLNLVSMTFDFPSPVPFGQLRVAVPWSDQEWRATGPDEWLQVRERTRSKPLLLSSVVDSLLAGGGDVAASASCTVLGDFTILHAILQRIQTLRQAFPVIPHDISMSIE